MNSIGPAHSQIVKTEFDYAGKGRILTNLRYVIRGLELCTLITGDKREREI